MNKLLIKRTSGFTVMELMVAMVISGIVVLAALQFYIVFNKMILQKNKTMEGRNAELQFYNLIKTDMDSAVTVKYSRDELTFQLPQDNPVHYEFMDEYVVRYQNSLSDTFRLQATNIAVENENITGYVKAIKFEIQQNGGIIPIIIEKTYANDVLLNATISPNK